jgi:cytochrome c553
LLDVGAKPRRAPEDIVGLLKDPPAYGLQPPMRSFADKLTDEQMREIAAWVVKLKR